MVVVVVEGAGVVTVDGGEAGSVVVVAGTLTGASGAGPPTVAWPKGGWVPGAAAAGRAPAVRAPANDTDSAAAIATIRFLVTGTVFTIGP
jgi:hypothetical protein